MDCSCKPKKKLLCLKILISILIFLVLIFLIFSLNKENKSILTAIAVEGDNTQLGTTTIKFSQNELTIGNALTHEQGSDAINVNKSGIYQISYQLFGIKEGRGSFNFNSALIVNDNVIDSTFNDGPVIEDLVNNRNTLTSTVILQLNEGDVLKLGGISIEDICYEKARIDIEKID